MGGARLEAGEHQRGPADGVGHGSGYRPGLGGAVADLALEVPTPAIRFAGGREPAGAKAAGRELHEGEPAGDGRRSRAVGQRSVTDLAGLAGAPAVADAGAREPARIERARGQAYERQPAGHRDGRGPVRGGAVAERTVLVEAPAPGGAGGVEGAAVRVAGGDGRLAEPDLARDERHGHRPLPALLVAESDRTCAGAGGLPRSALP